MQDRAGLIHAKLPHEFHADLPGLVRAQTTEFEVDTSREKFVITFNPRGYLKRVA